MSRLSHHHRKLSLYKTDIASSVNPSNSKEVCWGETPGYVVSLNLYLLRFVCKSPKSPKPPAIEPGAGC